MQLVCIFRIECLDMLQTILPLKFKALILFLGELVRVHHFFVEICIRNDTTVANIRLDRRHGALLEFLGSFLVDGLNRALPVATLDVITGVV